MTKPILVKDDGTCGPTALAMIEKMASEHKSQASIAKALGISLKKFKGMLERQKGENPERLAWESGHADFEQEMIDYAKAQALGSVVLEPVLDKDTGLPVLDAQGKPVMEKVRVVSKAATIAFIFFAKAQLGWQEKDNGGSTFQDNRINITLPAPISRDEMFKRLGIDAPLDFRKMKDVTPMTPGQMILPAPGSPPEPK